MRTLQKPNWFYRTAVLAVLFLAAGAISAQVPKRGPAMRPGAKKHLTPAGLSKPTGYTHVVVAQPGKMIFISGQIALNEKGEVVGAGDLQAQAVRVFENLSAALRAADASWDDVVKINTYVVNYNASMLPMLREARSKYLTGANPPASTLVGVQALARPEFLIEIEAVAVIP